ncbi:MAG: HlyD family secretion protein [Paracoccaceae bacterium]
MLELLLCASLTVLPDYLLRRRLQGKRWGREITFFSMWYELRYGITGCLILTVATITMIFYYHPSTSNVTLFFRTVSILGDTTGRVAEVHVRNTEVVEAGEPIFTFEDREERARLEAARQRLAEAEAAQSVAEARLAAATAQEAQAAAALRQAQDDLARSEELLARGSSAISAQEAERRRSLVDVRRAALEAAGAERAATEAEVRTVLPTRVAAARASVDEAQVILDRTVVRAGVTGRLEQFTLQVGDLVGPNFRTGGVLVPSESGRRQAQAGFDQLSAAVVTPGTLAEMSCASKPFTVIPMVVTAVQDVIAAGQFRPTDRLVETSAIGPQGSITVYMEPLWPGGLDGVPPGSRCVANAYTTTHDRLDDPGLSTLGWVYLHVVEAVGVVHAAMLRIQTLRYPIMQLVLGAH